MLKPEDYLLADGRYYYDNAATTKMSPKALQVYMETAERWFMNPMSYKDFDPAIEKLLQGARTKIIDFLGGNPYSDKLIFTSGATESINLLVKGYYFANFQEKRKIITSPIEHKAVLETVKYLETIGAEVAYVDIDSDGHISYDHLELLVDQETLCVCLMHVNNETGEISDLERIHEICETHNVPFFTDTTQSITKLQVHASNFEACVGSAHKFRGPKGVGFLYFKGRLKLQRVIHGGGQEDTLRPGTQNLPAILSMSNQLSSPAKENNNLIISHLNSSINQDVQLIGKCRSPYILALKFPLVKYSDSHSIEARLDKFIYSKGSACTNELQQQSLVYRKIAKGKLVLRFSL